MQFVGPTLTQKKDAVRILEEVDDQRQRYLLVMPISKVLVAVLTWLAFEMIGLELAGVWGAAAGILHFIPSLIVAPSFRYLGIDEILAEVLPAAWLSLRASAHLRYPGWCPGAP